MRTSITQRVCVSAAAEGATIVTHRSNVPFLRDVLNRPRTLRPDALTRTPRKIEFLPVDDRLTLKGAGREIQLYRLKGMDHVDGMLVVYLPQVKALVEADAFNPPAKAARRRRHRSTLTPCNCSTTSSVSASWSNVSCRFIMLPTGVRSEWTN